MEAFSLPDLSEELVNNEQLEKAWINSIQIKVEEYLENEPNLLFSYLYRLDIDEKKLQDLLSSASPDQLPKAIAIEIWLRQKQRMLSKKQHQIKPNIDKDWSW